MIDDRSISSASVTSDDLYSSSESSGNFFVTERNTHDEICIIPVYKDAIQISRNCHIGEEDASKLHGTLIEIQQIEFGALNQIQCSSLNLTEELGLDTMEGYLPDTYFTSNNCHHILTDKHFAVFELNIHNLYNVWLPRVQKRDEHYRPPPKSDMVRFLYIMGFAFLWNIGY